MDLIATAWRGLGRASEAAGAACPVDDGMMGMGGGDDAAAAREVARQRSRCHGAFACSTTLDALLVAEGTGMGRAWGDAVDVAVMEARLRDVRYFDVAPAEGISAPLAMGVCLGVLTFYVAHAARLYAESPGRRQEAEKLVLPEFAKYDFDNSLNYFASYIAEDFQYDTPAVVVGMVFCCVLAVGYIVKIASMTVRWRSEVLNGHRVRVVHHGVEGEVLRRALVCHALPVYDTGTALGRFRDAVCRVVLERNLAAIHEEVARHRVLKVTAGHEAGPVGLFLYVKTWYKLTVGSGGKYTGVKVVLTEILEFVVQLNAFLQLGGTSPLLYIWHGGATEQYRLDQASLLLAENESVMELYALLLLLNCVGSPAIMAATRHLESVSHNGAHLMLKVWDVTLDLGYIALTFWIAMMRSEQLFGSGSKYTSFVGKTYGEWFTLWFPFFSVWNSLPDAWEAAMAVNAINLVVRRRQELVHAGGGIAAVAPADEIAGKGFVEDEGVDLEGGPGKSVAEANARTKRKRPQDRLADPEYRPIALVRDGTMPERALTEGHPETPWLGKLVESAYHLRRLDDHDDGWGGDAWRWGALLASLVSVIAGIFIFAWCLYKLSPEARVGTVCEDASFMTKPTCIVDPYDTAPMPEICRINSFELTEECQYERCQENMPEDYIFAHYYGCEVPTAKNDDFATERLFKTGISRSLEAGTCYCTAGVFNLHRSWESNGKVPDGLASYTPGLRVAYLSGSVISDSALRDAVAKFPSAVETLDVSRNVLTALDANLKRLTNLHDLVAHENFIERLDPSVWGLPLRKLSLQHNCLGVGNAGDFALDLSSVGSCAYLQTVELMGNRLGDDFIAKVLEWIVDGRTKGCTLRKWDDSKLWMMSLRSKIDWPAYYKPMLDLQYTGLSTMHQPDSGSTRLSEALAAGQIPYLYLGYNPDLPTAEALQAVADAPTHTEALPADGRVPWYGLSLSAQANLSAALAPGEPARAHLEAIARNLEGAGNGAYVGLKCADLTEIPLSSSILSDATAAQRRVWVDLTCNPVCTEANAVRTERGWENNEGNRVLYLFDNGAGTWDPAEDPEEVHPLILALGTGLTVFCSFAYDEERCAPREWFSDREDCWALPSPAQQEERCASKRWGGIAEWSFSEGQFSEEDEPWPFCDEHPEDDRCL